MHHQSQGWTHLPQASCVLRKCFTFPCFILALRVCDLHFACSALQVEVPKHKGWLQNAAQSQRPPGAAIKDVVIPLEFKTGKPFSGHNAQVHQVTYSTPAVLPAVAGCCQILLPYQATLMLLLTQR